MRRVIANKSFYYSCQIVSAIFLSLYHTKYVRYARQFHKFHQSRDLIFISKFLFTINIIKNCITPSYHLFKRRKHLSTSPLFKNFKHSLHFPTYSKKEKKKTRIPVAIITFVAKYNQTESA